MKNRKLKVKSLLLDQKFIAGIGNIYADEALFHARVYPAKRANYLSKAEKERLFEAIPVVLEKGIRYGGTSLRDYVDSEGREGSNQQELSVYGREKKPCDECSTPIRRVG